MMGLSLPLLVVLFFHWSFCYKRWEERRLRKSPVQSNLKQSHCYNYCSSINIIIAAVSNCFRSCVER
jgi:hypothetical protein